MFQTQVSEFWGRSCFTLTAQILLFLQHEEAVLTGVTSVSTCIGLTVALSTFLHKQESMRKIWRLKYCCAIKSVKSLSHLIKRCVVLCVYRGSNEILTCSHSPTPLRVPFRSHWHSGMRRGRKREERLWKYKGGSTVNRPWLQDFVTFMGEHTAAQKPTIFRDLHIKGPEIYWHGLLSTRWKKKHPLNVRLQSTRGILRILKALFFSSCVFRQCGCDNILATEQNCNIRQVSGQSLKLFTYPLDNGPSLLFSY